MYETKYAIPGEKLYKAAVAVLKTDPGYTKFNHAIDWTWFEIWHHEGRRARHGAAMMAPDYTHWHGTYDLAKHWMTKYVPEIKEIIHDFARKAGGEGTGRRPAGAYSTRCRTPTPGSGRSTRKTRRRRRIA